MPEEHPKPSPETPAEPAAEVKPPEVKPTAAEIEQDAGDFITRHVLEKDSVFFEG